MTGNAEVQVSSFRQDPEHLTHYCGACGKEFGFPESVPISSPCHLSKLWPVEGGGDFAISREVMEEGFRAAILQHAKVAVFTPVLRSRSSNGQAEDSESNRRCFASLNMTVREGESLPISCVTI